jgi:pilus assembly protein CpaE
MARLISLAVSDDTQFRAQIGALLRSTAVPVTISEDSLLGERGANSDLVIIDARGDIGVAMGVVERHRARSAAAAIFAIASEASPDVILQSMRAGANEFFTWPPPDDAFKDAIRRAAARRASSSSAPEAKTMVFFGVKGGAGTTTLAVNCGVEIARLSQRPTIIVDLKPGLGEVALFLGIRSRYTLLDALDNAHRLDAQFFRELVVNHKSGLDILAGSSHFDRPGGSDGAALEELFRLLSTQYEYILIDAGNQLNSASIAALYMADTICLVANPDVPSIRNAQKLLARIEQLGASGERVRLLLNRAAEPSLIAPSQIESALGRPIDHTFPSNYKVVSAALNSGVPLALSGNTDLAAQFDSFTRRVLGSPIEAPEDTSKPRALRLGRIASIW